MARNTSPSKPPHCFPEEHLPTCYQIVVKCSLLTCVVIDCEELTPYLENDRLKIVRVQYRPPNSDEVEILEIP